MQVLQQELWLFSSLFPLYFRFYNSFIDLLTLLYPFQLYFTRSDPDILYNPNNPVCHSKRDRWFRQDKQSLLRRELERTLVCPCDYWEPDKRLHVLSGCEYWRHWRNSENKFHGHFQNDKNLLTKQMSRNSIKTVSALLL